MMTQDSSAMMQVAGIPFAVSDLERATSRVIELATGTNIGTDERGVPVRLMNAYCVALASEDPAYMQLVQGRGINFPDGRPVAWLMRRSGAMTADQVRGPSLFENVIDRGRAAGLRNYFFGTTDETLTLLTEKLQSKFPGMIMAGALEAPFAPAIDIVTDEVVSTISAARPHVVWVGLGTPKQDYVGEMLSARLGIPCLSVGAAFDFSAGTLRVAPAWVRRSGLEWLHRLASEPRRLGRRYVWGNSRFISLARAQLMRPDKGQS